MNSIAVYTAVTNGYDALNRAPEIDGVDFIVFSDRAMGGGNWQWRPLPDEVAELSPRMQAKWPKLLPHLAVPNHEVTVWIDASHRIISPAAIQEIVARLASGSAGFILHKHPWRDCIYDEATASMELWKYASQPIEEQVAAYREDGHPEHWGLWACGSMARVNGERINAAMEHWWQECTTWSYQDQLSLPVVMREAGWLPDEFDHHQVFSNPWFVINPHPRDNE